MNSKYFLVPVLAMLACGALKAQNADTTPSATPGYSNHEHWRHHHHAWIWKKLGLTDAQKAQIKSIRQGFKGQIRPALAAVLTAKLKLRQDIAANSSQATIAADTSALATAEAQFATVRASEFNQVKAVLTQDQQNTLNTFVQKRQARMQDRINKLSQPTS
jgi:Spy/CpxP family protein refolding chaperone